jgi:lipid-binding SYLF domain-containing protein
MTDWSRRSFLAAAGCGLVACTSQPAIEEDPRQRLDRRVDIAISELYSSVPGAQELGARSQGMLIIPGIRKAGFFASGAYGEGALVIGPAKVEYYSLSAAGLGFTFGAAEYNQALFFLTSQALQDFRLADGWQLGAEAAVTVPSGGASAGISSIRINRPIVEVVYAQRGLIADASFAGAKYSRIVR